MKTTRILISLLFSVLLILSSCVSSKKLTYLQYSDKFENETVVGNEAKVTVTPATYRIMPYDNLYIRVITPDPRWSELFNTVPVGQGGALTEESAGLLGYPVDGSGYIEIPFVGKLLVGGKTVSEVKTELDTVLKNYVTDAAITVRLVNNSVSILGEVRIPGRYPLSKDRINIFEALAMAGDLNQFSNRQKIQIIRPSAYGPIIKEFSLADRSILVSEFYYVMPNDIIYAPPVKSRTFQENSSVYSIVLSSLTTLFVIWGFFR